MGFPRILALAIALSIGSSAIYADGGKHGQSKHGTAFDAGLRTRPWEMKGIGRAPFPISTKNQEVQRWYDQGNALLQSFWFEEAERSFRWCHKLEPENAMVYFGLARCGLNWFTLQNPDDMTKRYRDFLAQAVKRKAAVTERERMYIEAWDATFSSPMKKRQEVMARKLGEIVVKFPHDVEAKVMLGFANIHMGSALATDLVLQEALRLAPDHPGAHHARIHNWDGVLSDQAIDSCERYGRVAPGTGHALHMPGHIYSKIGMWHEAAIAMDSSTRMELKYMNQRLALPWETWNYAHNRDYLCYIQEQLGRANDSIQGAKDLINAPKDPEWPAEAGYWAQMPLMRALVKFERWEEILDGSTLQKSADPFMNTFQMPLEVIALAKTNRLPEAQDRLKKFQTALAFMNKMSPPPTDEEAMPDPSIFKVAEAYVRFAEGNRAEGIGLLRVAADAERKARADGLYSNDPPMDPWPVLRLLGDALAEDGDHAGAIRAYNEALHQEPNDAWCLAGLAKSWVAQGRRDIAQDFAGRFLAVWSQADPGLKLMQEVIALGLDAKPTPVTLRPERTYNPRKLDGIGPSNWAPFAAPSLSATGVDGKPVRLEDYRGKNVLLVFYLSDQCVHCVEQLTAINAKFDKFHAADTVVLAISSDSPEKNRSNQLSGFNLNLISDENHENARRFASYDDFEDMELHSTILIDREGRVRWKRTGGDPFMKIDYLLAELKRWGNLPPRS